MRELRSLDYKNVFSIYCLVVARKNKFSLMFIPTWCWHHVNKVIKEKMGCQFARICYLKFDIKIDGKPVKSRVPVFCLHVVYSPELAEEKILYPDNISII